MAEQEEQELDDDERLDNHDDESSESQAIHSYLETQKYWETCTRPHNLKQSGAHERAPSRRSEKLTDSTVPARTTIVGSPSNPQRSGPILSPMRPTTGYKPLKTAVLQRREERTRKSPTTGQAATPRPSPRPFQLYEAALAARINSSTPSYVPTLQVTHARKHRNPIQSGSREWDERQLLPSSSSVTGGPSQEQRENSGSFGPGMPTELGEQQLPHNSGAITEGVDPSELSARASGSDSQIQRILAQLPAHIKTNGVSLDDVKRQLSRGARDALFGCSSSGSSVTEGESQGS